MYGCFPTHERLRYVDAVPDDSAALILKNPQGAVEKGLFDIAAANPSFETFVLRPGAVLPANSVVKYAIAAPIIPVVYVSDLAKALVTTCLTQPMSKVIENKEIIKMAKTAS